MESNEEFRISWFNPRKGGDFSEGSIKTISGAGSQGVGVPPDNTGNDWVAIITKLP